MSILKKSDYFSLSNEELVSLSQKGDATAKEVITRRFFNTPVLISNNSVFDKDDFLQESMLGFLNAVETYDSLKGVPFEAFALLCMRRKIYTATKKTADVPMGDNPELFEELSGEENPLDKVILSEDLSNVISNCEKSLSKTEKAVVFLIAGGLSYDEVGKRLGLAPKSVDNALQRARRKLKNLNN